MAALMARGREMRAQAALQQEQRAQQWEKDKNDETEQGARDMAAAVTATLEEKGMKEECFKSLERGSPAVCWFAQKNSNLQDDKEFFFIVIEGTRERPPYVVWIVANGMKRTWIMNPCPRGADATPEDCHSCLGGPHVFARAYEAIVEAPLPAGADHTSTAAHKALHAAVILRPTIEVQDGNP